MPKMREMAKIMDRIFVSPIDAWVFAPSSKRTYVNFTLFAERYS